MIPEAIISSSAARSRSRSFAVGIEVQAPQREELADPTFDAEPKEKMHFDAGPELKAVIEELTAEIGVGKSRFFAFVLSEAATELEQHEQPQGK